MDSFTDAEIRQVAMGMRDAAMWSDGQAACECGRAEGDHDAECPACELGGHAGDGWCEPVSEASEAYLHGVASDMLHGIDRADVLAYCRAMGPLPTASELERFGHDAYLTQAGHGAGFWDRGLGELGDRLTDAMRGYSIEPPVQYEAGEPFRFPDAD